jgi:glutathione synthase/RimK-type ligase-like ATP-grasp enzyme
MLTLLGSLLGFLGSAFPQLLKLFQEAQDRRHELAILDRQMEVQRQGHSQRLEEIRIEGVSSNQLPSTSMTVSLRATNGWKPCAPRYASFLPMLSSCCSRP